MISSSYICDMLICFIFYLIAVSNLKSQLSEGEGERIFCNKVQAQQASRQADRQAESIPMAGIKQDHHHHKHSTDTLE